MCDCARASDVTESINYKLHFLNRKLITEGILRYFCHKSTFEDKNVCRQTCAGMQFHSVDICLRFFRKVHVYSLFTLETVSFPECLLFLDSDKRLHQ